MLKFIATIILYTCLQYVTSDVIVYSRLTGQIMDEYRDMPARFGPQLPQTGIRYAHIKGNPANGCSDMDRPPFSAENITSPIKWAVVIARLGCSFEDKIRNAQKADFDAVIVHNVGSNDLGKFSSSL